MKRSLSCLSAAALLLAGCIDFDQSWQEFCASVTPERRAQICQDGPRVVTESPIDGATGVTLSAQPTVAFDQRVTCSPAGLKLVQFTAGEPVVAGTTACNTDHATFSPTSQFLSGRVYRVYITPDIKNDAGTPAIAAWWTFTTW